MTDQNTLDTAARIAAGDDQTNYDSVAIFLHWTTAILVLFQFVSAETWDYFGKATRDSMQSLHVSLGVLLTAVILVRVIWRLIPGHQRPTLVSGWVELSSKAVHYLLYALLIAQAALGFAFRWAQGHPVSFFGLGIPGPFPALAKPTRHLLHGLHEKAGWAIIILASGHAHAALCHQYRLHDRVLGRMFPPARRNERARQ